jgi:transcriptional regulator with XRE-family HTH domain
MVFHLKLTGVIDARGESQRDVARVAGVSHTTANRWCAGSGIPDMREAALLARHYGVPLEFLADDAQDEPPALDPAEAKLLELARRIGVEVAIDRILANVPAPPAAPPGRRYVHAEPAAPPAPRQRRKPG